MVLATIAIATLATIGAAGTVGAGVEPVCPDLDTGKIDPPGDPTSLVITAPPGQVIVQVCVKAGSAQQGDGPEFTDFDPGVTETTISHSSGKEISHYSVKYAPAPPPPNGTVPPPPTTAKEQPAPKAVPSVPAPVRAAPVFTG